MKAPILELRCQRQDCRCYRDPQGKLVGKLTGLTEQQARQTQIELVCPNQKSKLIYPVPVPVKSA